jgi:hypothetical protein
MAFRVLVEAEGSSAHCPVSGWGTKVSTPVSTAASLEESAVAAESLSALEVSLADASAPESAAMSAVSAGNAPSLPPEPLSPLEVSLAVASEAAVSTAVLTSALELVASSLHAPIRTAALIHASAL